MLEKYRKHTLLNNVIECVGTVSLLLSGTPLSNWQNVMEKLPAGNFGTEETFDHAMSNLRLSAAATKPGKNRNVSYNAT
jgi:hypothetical protein